MVNSNSIASSTLTQRPANRLAEAVVGGENDEIVLDVVGLAPGGHDKGVVVSNHDDLVNTLGLEGLAVVDVCGEVRGLAGGGEGTGDGDKNDLLLLEFWRGG